MGPQSAGEFLFNTRRQPPELVTALRLMSTEAVCINWSMAWRYGDDGVLIALDSEVRKAVFDLAAFGMAEPEQVHADVYTDEHGEPVVAARLVITAEGRRLLEILEGKL